MIGLEDGVKIYGEGPKGVVVSGTFCVHFGHILVGVLGEGVLI
jgi:hypothetical protein